MKAPREYKVTVTADCELCLKAIRELRDRIATDLDGVIGADPADCDIDDVVRELRAITTQLREHD